MRKEPKAVETDVIQKVVTALTDMKELHRPEIQYFEAPDFIVTDSERKFGVELVSYHVDSKRVDGKIWTQKRIEWEQFRKKSGVPPPNDNGWIGISFEIIELALSKGEKLDAYRKRNLCNEYWLVIHTNNFFSYESIGSSDVALFQNINFNAIVLHYAEQIKFDRIYIYDLMNMNFFGGPVPKTF